MTNYNRSARQSVRLLCSTLVTPVWRVNDLVEGEYDRKKWAEAVVTEIVSSGEKSKFV